ncbi:MAG: glycosyltransferase [Flavobacteriaceae bacterium]
MNKQPSITVLMPVYNCELYVEEALSSILNQTFSDFEVLIIDDASTDATVSIIKSFNDKRINLIVKPKNTGYTNSLNHGCKIAKGKYIARMDGDDVSLPERFEKQIVFLEANPDVMVCGTTYSKIGNPKRITIPQYHDDIKIRLLWGNCIAHPSVMIRKEALEVFSEPYDTLKEPAEDYDLWVRLLAVGKLHNLPDVLLDYRTYTNQVSRKRAQEQKRSEIETRFKMHDYLNVKWTPQEAQFLEKHFKRTEIISFVELKIFKQVQKKIAVANNEIQCFDSKLFKQYLVDFEIDILRKCFLKQKRYTPKLYFDYLNAKWKFGAKLPIKRELKLMLKSLIFWKTLRA